MTNRERRRYPRVPNNLGAYVTIADESFPAKARDVAPSGIRLECSDAIQERLARLRTLSGEYPMMATIPLSPPIAR